MKIDEQTPEQEKSSDPLLNNQQKAAQDISSIRDAQIGKEADRRTAFELVFEGKLLNGSDVWSLKEVIKENDAEVSKDQPDDLER